MQYSLADSSAVLAIVLIKLHAFIRPDLCEVILSTSDSHLEVLRIVSRTIFNSRRSFYAMTGEVVAIRVAAPSLQVSAKVISVCCPAMGALSSIPYTTRTIK